MKTLRQSDVETLNEAKEILKKFADSWLVEGSPEDLQGAGACCLSDTDLATALIPVIEILTD